MEWKYKIDLQSEQVFEEIAKEYGSIVPEMVKDFVRKYNAATPEKYNFLVGGTEKVFGAVLSFNKNDADNVFSALKIVSDKNMLPFGIDPFGNYICVRLTDNMVYFWDLEADAAFATGKTFDEFIKSLY